MNEVERLKAWYKKRIKNWDETVCMLGFTSIVLNLLATVFFAAGKQSPIAILFFAGVIIDVIGVNFLTHEYEIESREEFLKIFLKKVIKCSETEGKIEVTASASDYQKIPYDMLMKALGDYGFSVTNTSWLPFTEKDYDRGSTLYLIRGRSNV